MVLRQLVFYLGIKSESVCHTTHENWFQRLKCEKQECKTVDRPLKKIGGSYFLSLIQKAQTTNKNKTLYKKTP